MLIPSTLSTSLKDAILATSSVKDLSREIISILTYLLDTECRQSRDFLLKVADSPVINHALIGFFISLILPMISL